MAGFVYDMVVGGLVDDEGDGEAVVAFVADGLDGGGGDAGFAADGGEDFAGADDAGVGGVFVGYGAGAGDVVDEDEGAGVGEFEGPGEVVGGGFFVRVDEDEVEGADVFGEELGEGFDGGADADGDVFEVGGCDVFAGDFSVVGVEFEGGDVAGGADATGEADRAEAAKGADFEDFLSAGGGCEEHEELALVGGDLDGRQAAGGGVFKGGVEGRVGGEEVLGVEVVDGGPFFLGHGGLRVWGELTWRLCRGSRGVVGATRASRGRRPGPIRRASGGCLWRRGFGLGGGCRRGTLLPSGLVRSRG